MKGVLNVKERMWFCESYVLAFRERALDMNAARLTKEVL